MNILILRTVHKKIIDTSTLILLLLNVASAQLLRQPIVSVSPAMNATGVAVHVPVNVDFSTAMFPAAFNPSTVFMVGDRSGKHNGIVSYDQGKRELSFVSDKKFIFGEQIQFTLTDSVGSAEPYQPIIRGFGYKFLTEVLQGSGLFSVQEQSLSSSPSPYAIAAGDFNGDGYSDCAVTQKNSASVSVYLNNKRNGFFPPVNYSAGSSPEAIVVADLTGDGLPDIVVANRLANSISILTNNGDGTFSARQFPVGKEPVSLAVSECDNDGARDIATVTAADSLFRLYKYDNSTLTVMQSIKLSGIPSALLLDDLNNDGYIDCAVTLRSRNSLVLFKSDSSGKFLYDTEYGVGLKPEAVIAFDAVLGSDGYIDLATVNNGTNNISILKNDKTGHFQGPEHFAIGGSDPVAICGNDFDGDGDVDLAISNRTSKSVVIFRNNGVGLPDTVSIPLNASPRGIVALDITGTYGIMDIIVCNDQTGTLSILRNKFISQPSPELNIGHDTIHFTQTALKDTTTVHAKVFSAITPTKIDSIRFFSKQFSMTNLFPIQLASYDSVDLSLRYAPGTYGNHRDSVILYSSAGVFTMYLRGESPAPVLIASSVLVDFGEIKMKDTSRVSMKLKNVSINKIIVASVSNQVTAISAIYPSMPLTLQSNDSVTITLRFIPDTIQSYHDTLRIVCNPASASLLIPLMGKGKTSLSVTRQSVIIPAEYVLGQNYPNPFNPATTIPFALPVSSMVTIDVYDLVGRKVSNIFSGERQAGYHTIQWNASELSSGVYYYRMTAVSPAASQQFFTNSKKILLIK